MILEVFGKKALCRCDFCDKEVQKYLSQLTNLTYQFCNQSCSTSAKRSGEVIDQQLRSRSRAMHGVDHHLQRDDVKQKRIITNVKKYGVSNQFQRHDIIALIGVKARNRTPEEWIAIRQKSKETCLHRYGVDHPTQYHIIHERQLRGRHREFKRGNFDTPWGEFWYRSSWELRFLEWCVLRVSHVEPNIGIWYMYEGKRHMYFADFLITFASGRRFLCEIKPEKLARHLQNQAKFAVAQSWALQHDATFVHIDFSYGQDLNSFFPQETINT
jgi:hypothetical protein